MSPKTVETLSPTWLSGLPEHFNPLVAIVDEIRLMSETLTRDQAQISIG